MKLSGCSLEHLREDGELVLYREDRPNRTASASVLLLAPARPTRGNPKKNRARICVEG
jgi:hypothetical protein